MFQYYLVGKVVEGIEVEYIKVQVYIGQAMGNRISEVSAEACSSCIVNKCVFNFHLLSSIANFTWKCVYVYVLQRNLNVIFFLKAKKS